MQQIPRSKDSPAQAGESFCIGLPRLVVTSQPSGWNDMKIIPAGVCGLS